MNPPVDLVWIDSEDFRFPEWIELRQVILRDPIGLTYSEEDLESERDERHLIAGDTMGILGGLAVKVVDQGHWKVRQVAVAEIMQGRGLGQLLMRHMMAAAQSERVPRILLHSRESVVPFYEKLGFSTVGEGFLEVGIPHRLMEITFPFSSPA
ncbi:MAG: GNAT family N-acetyltransferase [Verrucomicrobiales bacterium]|nr:GNAT family N-acetyltransferase [Verrucomicrobiales bacterium]